MDFIKQIFDQNAGEETGSSRRRLGLDNRTDRSSGVSAAPEVELDLNVLEANRVFAHIKSDPRTVSYDMLRTRLLREMVLRGWKTVAITSPTPASGKSLTAINLGFSISHSTTHTAVLADFDLRRPTIANYLGLPQDLRAVVECFEGTARPQDVMVKVGLPNFVVLPNLYPVENAAETLASDRAEHLVTDLRDLYLDGIVLLDLPPLLEVDDTLSILPKVDCVLLIVAAGQSTANEIKECKRLLSPYNLVGTVLNKSNTKTNEYDYY